MVWQLTQSLWILFRDPETKITALPEPSKPKILREMIEEACSDKRSPEKRARIANANGGKIDRTAVFPTVLENVPLDSDIATYEQFGPVVG